MTGLRRRARGAADRPLIEATFGFTIEANLLESFTGQGLCKGEGGGGAPAIRKIEPSAHSEGGRIKGAAILRSIGARTINTCILFFNAAGEIWSAYLT